MNMNMLFEHIHLSLKTFLEQPKKTIPAVNKKAFTGCFTSLSVEFCMSLLSGFT